jgi:predicted exporter
MTRRRVALAAWVAAIALCVLQVAGTRFVADLSSFLPSAPTAEQKLLVDQLRDGALSRLLLIGIEGGDEVSRAAASRGLAATLAVDARFATVANGAGDGLARERDLVFANRYALSPRMTPERFTVEGLRAAIAETLDALASPAGLALKTLVPRDPTLETLAVVEGLRPGGAPAMREGVWTSPDGSRALLVARTRAAGSDTDAQEQALDAVQSAFKRAAASSAGLRLSVTGPGAMSVRARTLIKHDVEKLAAVSLGIVAALLLAVYRSPRALLLGLVPVACGALAGVAAVSLGFGEVHGITLGFGTTLIGEAVDYSIYLFVQSERAAQAADERWLAGFWPTIRLGVLTSIAGFCALLFAGLPGLAQLGVYSIAGLAAAAAVTRFVLPQLLPRSFRIRDVTHAGVWLIGVFAPLARVRWLVPAIALASAAVLAM